MTFTWKDDLIWAGVAIEDIDIEFGNLRSELGINGFVGNDILSRFTLTIEYATQHITLRR